ncbi:ATP-binding protein [Rubripirellula reticaptiva]|uniref:AAA+ ATPase domain-containing protein n=1 Tax=Rubripirellula reticaptiva TaxID=2528013 RepID=A0A5C6EQM9_9BACT|nr:AAA family ATPase [Rubripirellula reticaptiva]TWU49871.1 hypothetical protein Poly59_44960 [Rubripirellula reticaptiva]
MSGDVDSKLDSLISRIQTLSAGGTPAASLASLATSQPESSAPQPNSPAQAARPAPAPAAAEAQRPSGSPSGPAIARPTGEPAQPRPARSPEPLGFKPSRDEPWRPGEPADMVAAGVNETLLEAIIYRFIRNIGEAAGRRIADQVKLPFGMIEPLLTRLKAEQNVAYKNSTSTNDYVYMLTESGRAIARGHMQDCTYYGACPVPLKEYIASVKRQTIEGQYPKKQDLLNAFKDLLINPAMLNKLGPAVASGRGMFLFGFPGNGKTSIAERVTGAFGKYVWIPRAIDIDGDVLRVFDPMCHELAMPEAGSGLLDIGGFDKRWVRIRRPTIIAGGELTMDMLEVQSNSESNISESPLQLKSNCGTLVIDDFGRQRMRVDELLNRWIVPLEKRYDFLNMASGKKIQVPFDQLVVFSTNLEPKDLVDDAFLRRIPYKIEAENPPEADFRKLFEIMCKVVKIPYEADPINYLIEKHYKAVDRPMRMCQPRDLLLQVKNYCLYNDLPIELKHEYMDFACENYFSVM